MNTKPLMFVAIAITGMCGSGCTSPAEKASPTTSSATISSNTPVNKYCPVDPKSPIDPTVTLMYNGKCYGFCCSDCIKEFKKNPAKYAAEAK